LKELTIFKVVTINKKFKISTEVENHEEETIQIAAVAEMDLWGITNESF